MLTPAIFEDRMRAIRMSAKDTPTMLYQAHQLMAEALDDLEKIGKFEPNITKAAWNIFGKSYVYRQQYNQYKRLRLYKESMIPGQMSMFDFIGGDAV